MHVSCTSIPPCTLRTASSAEAAAVLRHFGYVVHNRNIILSKRGYYSLVPGIVQEGDVCCIIFATRSPFVLRTTGRDGYYKFVGSALILSKELGHNRYPEVLGYDGKFED